MEIFLDTSFLVAFYNEKDKNHLMAYGKKIYQGFKDKEWSFTDCTSYVLMKNLAIDIGASFDDHFSQFGFNRVPA